MCGAGTSVELRALGDLLSPAFGAGGCASAGLRSEKPQGGVGLCQDGLWGGGWGGGWTGEGRHRGCSGGVSSPRPLQLIALVFKVG